MDDPCALAVEQVKGDGIGKQIEKETKRQISIHNPIVQRKGEKGNPHDHLQLQYDNEKKLVVTNKNETRKIMIFLCAYTVKLSLFQPPIPLFRRFHPPFKSPK